MNEFSNKILTEFGIPIEVIIIIKMFLKETYSTVCI
jgi:hypothetical protein